MGKLKPEFKAKWLEALRSGDYIQTKHYLCRRYDTGTFHCCLGVAHEVEHGKEAWQDYSDGPVANLLSVHDDSDLYTPPGIGVAEAERLAAMNDDGATFGEIADYIEEHY